MIKDAPAGRNPDTALRDLLRRMERTITASHPARPNPPAAAALTSAATSAAAPLRIGDWELAQDPTSGDLVATDTRTGTATTVARKGGT